MNLVTTRTLHPHLREDELLVVENAIRLAIDSIVNVLFGVNSARNVEYQRMVGDRDKEIRRLERRLEELEQELVAPRQRGCSCGAAERTSASNGLGAQTSCDLRTEGQNEFERSCGRGEVTAVPREGDSSAPLTLFTTHSSSQSHESSLPMSPSRLGSDQGGTPGSSESSSFSEASRNLPISPSGLVVKEEPCDMATVFIKWEMSEEGLGEAQESTVTSHPDKESPGEKGKLESRERIKFTEQHHTVPDRHGVAEGEQVRNKKKSVPMSELTEEAQRLKRAAWRAASRRYYARKIARQQANPQHVGSFPRISHSQYSHHVPLVDVRRRTLMSELPADSQTLQREAWRAASRRYYARKTARHQVEPSQYAHLLQNMEPSEESVRASRGGPHSDGGGIMCS